MAVSRDFLFYFVDYEVIEWSRIDEAKHWYSVDFSPVMLTPAESVEEFEKMDHSFLLYLSLVFLSLLSWFVAIVLFQWLSIKDSLARGRALFAKIRKKNDKRFFNSFHRFS